MSWPKGPKSDKHRASLIAAWQHRDRAAAAEVAKRMSAFWRGRKHTLETRARISASLKATLAANPELRAKRSPKGRTLSAATKAKISASHVGMRHTPEACAKMSASKMGKTPHSHEFYRRLGDLNRGRARSIETRKKLSAAGYGHKAHHATGKTFVYQTIRFRSSWEIRAAMAFDRLGIKWMYEPKRFYFEGFTYAPDFYLPHEGAFWEIKGWFHERSQQIISAMRRLHPELPLVVVNERMLKELEASAARVA